MIDWKTFFDQSVTNAVRTCEKIPKILLVKEIIT